MSSSLNRRRKYSVRTSCSAAVIEISPLPSITLPINGLSAFSFDADTDLHRFRPSFWNRQSLRPQSRQRIPRSAVLNRYKSCRSLEITSLSFFIIYHTQVRKQYQMCKSALHIFFCSPDSSAYIKVRALNTVFFGDILYLAVVDVNKAAAVWAYITVIGENAAFIETNISAKTLIVDIIWKSAHCFCIITAAFLPPLCFKKLAKYIVTTGRVHYNNLYPYYTDIIHFSKNKTYFWRRNCAMGIKNRWRVFS